MERLKNKSYLARCCLSQSLRFYCLLWGLPVAQRVKHLPAMQETWVQSLGQEDPLEKEIETRSSILAWEILWLQRVGHD